jgi:hypothetical protein
MGTSTNPAPVNPSVEESTYAQYTHVYHTHASPRRARRRVPRLGADLRSDQLPPGPNGSAPTHDAVARWHEAVRRAVVANHPDFVPEPARFRTTLDLARAKAVTLHEDGTATVRSGTHTYEIAPDCTCKDAETVSKYCKHLLATMIVKEAYCQLQPAQTPITQTTNGHVAAKRKDHDMPPTPPPRRAHVAEP